MSRFPGVRRAITAAMGVVVALGVSAGVADAATWQVAHPPFTPQSNVPYAPLAAVSPISATDVWAVGRADGAALTEHWNCTRWSAVALPSGPCEVFESSCQLTGVSADASGDVIAVGNGTLNTYPSWTAAALAFRWNGTAWASMSLPASIGPWSLAHVKTFSATDAWAVGQAASGPAGAPSAAHWNGTSWTSVATPVLTTLGLTMNAIAGSSGHDIWAVGLAESSGYHNKQRHSAIMHYDGSNWTQTAIPDTHGLLDVAALSPTNAWALGFDGSLLHWDGTAWTIKTVQPYATVLAAVSSTNVWVGSVVSVSQFNGSTWTVTALPQGISTLHAAAALSTGSVWFVGSYYAPAGSEVPAVLHN
jgi:hypothetical protein